jgi:hypothetical protein
LMDTRRPSARSLEDFAVETSRPRTAPNGSKSSENESLIVTGVGNINDAEEESAEQEAWHVCCECCPDGCCDCCSPRKVGTSIFCSKYINDKLIR